MGFYKLVTKDTQKELKKYTKFGEKIKISTSLEINKKIYKEIIFYKRFFVNISGEISGSMFINSEYNRVKDKNLITQLVRLSYFGEILCDDESNISLNRALKAEGDLKKDENDFEDIKFAFLILKKENLIKDKECNELEKIIGEFFKLRKENNNLMEEVCNRAKSLMVVKECVDNELIEEVYEEYIEVLMQNFFKVRHLLTGKHLYNDILDKLKKYKKKLKVKLKADNMNKLNKLEYTLFYYVKILNTYEPVLYMNKSQYERHLKNIEKENIENRIKALR